MHFDKYPTYSVHYDKGDDQNTREYLKMVYLKVGKKNPEVD